MWSFVTQVWWNWEIQPFCIVINARSSFCVHQGIRHCWRMGRLRKAYVRGSRTCAVIFALEDWKKWTKSRPENAIRLVSKIQYTVVVSTWTCWLPSGWKPRLSGSRLSDYIMFDTDAYQGKEHKKLTANQQNKNIGIVERGNWAAKTPGEDEWRSNYYLWLYICIYIYTY